MWRQNVHSETTDSDHSFSVNEQEEEEDFDGDFSANCVSLSGHAENVEGINILSQLEKLQDASRVLSSGNCYPSVGAENNAILSEDEVEAPDFEKEKTFICSSESKFMHNVEDEIISDEEDITDVSFCIYKSGKKDKAQAFSLQDPEGAALIKENGNASYSPLSSVPSRSKFSKDKKAIAAGSKGKAKPKFSFHFHSGKHERTGSSVSKENVDLLGNPPEPPQQSEENDCRTNEFVAAEDSRHINEEIESGPDIVPRIGEALDHQSTGHSMAELLDSLQDKTVSLEENFKLCENMVQSDANVRMAASRAKIVVPEHEPEHMDSEPQSDDEISLNDVELPVGESKGQSIVDRFQEILDTTLIDGGSFLSVPKSSCFGLFERLQKLMQSEKEKENEFLKILPNGANPSCNPGFIDVTILSRHLDAKLTVCHCSWKKNLKESLHDTSSGQRTVIFNPKMCNNVDLEIGSTIRIYSPWMEVPVSGYSETILLSTYYSQILDS